MRQIPGWIRGVAALLALLLTAAGASAIAIDRIGMVTGSPTGTYIKFGNDIADLAQRVGLNVWVKESEGSLANIERIASRENAAVGIVQSDVLGYLEQLTDAISRRTASRLRLIFPFYNEEVHLFARKDIRRIEDLEGKRVVVGTQGSGNFITSNNILHIAGVTPGSRIERAPDEGVQAVLTGDADAMFYVVGKPASAFARLTKLRDDPGLKELLESVHFVPLSDKRILKQYVAAQIGYQDYDWLDGSIPTVAVKAVLVSYDFSRVDTPYYRTRCGQIARLSEIIRSQIGELRQAGHRKWQEVDLDVNVGNWKRDECSTRTSTRVEHRRRDPSLSQRILSIIREP